ncbi:MAG: polysaccharide biosynthesis tyrosine autokinase [Candidatus Omnitrophica bacterium]|nr:polysaccharide biosynthesis tyrosine autokinase [Candidatus Omnitrophota bacterium]
MPQYELGFRDYWRIISKRRYVIIFTFLAVFIATVIYLNLQTPVYKAFATVRVEQRKTVAGALMEYIAWSAGDLLVTEAKVIESRLIAEKVGRRLGLITDKTNRDDADKIINTLQKSISTEKVLETNLIQIIVYSDEPKKAALIANEVAKAYVEHDVEQKNKQARQVREFIESQLVTVEENLVSSEDNLRRLKEEGRATGIAVPLESRIVDLKSKLSELLTRATEKHPRVWRIREQIDDLENQLRELPADELEFARLTREIKVNEKVYATLREKFEEARIAEAEKIEDVSIVDYATVPNVPVKPDKKTGTVLGVIVSLMLGFVLSFVVESLDTSIGTIEDVEELLKVPVVGVIPHVRTEETMALPWWRKGPFEPKPGPLDEVRVRRIVHDQPKSPIAETYRTLRTNLKISAAGRKIFLITSTGPREGKTTVLTNLALTCAQMGNKTLLVSTDLRRPALYKTFGIKREPGLNEVLARTLKWEKAVKGISDILIGAMGFDEAMKTPGLDNLSIFTSGHIPLNPSELLASKEMQALIEELKSKFDVILLDSPPTLPITDAMLLAPKVDGVILVYEIGRTARAALLRAKNQLESTGAKILGIVLNHIRPETEMYPTYYPQYYRYRYYGQEEKKGKKGALAKNDLGRREL